MKRLFILVLIVLVSVPLLNAQQRSWSTGPLRWDLLAKNTAGVDNVNHLAFDWSFSGRTVKPAWNTWMNCLMHDTKIDLGSSWHNAAYVNPTELAYDQVLFDIQEWMFRQCMSDYYSPYIGKSLEELMHEYQDEADRMSKQVTWDTDQGRKQEMVQMYSRQLKKYLEDCPLPTPSYSLKDWHFSLPMGVSYTRFMGDAGASLGPGYGMYTVADIGFKRHQFQTFFDISFDNRDSGFPQIGLDYGYTVYDGSTFRLAPFAGLSSQWINFNTSSSPAEGNKGKTTSSENIWNPCMLAGFTGEFKYLRVINCYPESDSENGSRFEVGLGLHCYVARSFPGMGLNALSLHFGLTYIVIHRRRLR